MLKKKKSLGKAAAFSSLSKAREAAVWRCKTVHSREVNKACVALNTTKAIANAFFNGVISCSRFIISKNNIIRF